MCISDVIDIVKTYVFLVLCFSCNTCASFCGVGLTSNQYSLNKEHSDRILTSKKISLYVYIATSLLLWTVDEEEINH